jgi:hypothetical protein
MNVPSLTEPGVKHWMKHTLKECRNFKDTNINYFYNIGLTILLVVGVGIFLVFNYKGNITQAEINEKNRIKQEYIVAKLQQISLVKKQRSATMLTDLPTWDDHPELAVLNRKVYL